ncbi:MAG TPA: ABC transporter ATP-binding protein [Planctomycetota bacterium]|nr:ABC transporter ATP-binding protein [Planctomycetota bacterium]
MPVVEAKGLIREFRAPFRRTTVLAVRGLDLAVEKGRVFGLLGPNGSGKTTTILMLLGLLKPTAGHATVLGWAAGHKDARRRTGFLPEETRLYEFLTGLETLLFAGRLFGIPRRERRARAEELVRRTGMWEGRDRRLSTYSKGMARRIGLAQALMARPELLVLDEPTSGLDPVGNREVRDLLREVAAEGTTVLLTSHILSDVAEVCDEIAILHRGRKILAGAVKDLLSDAKKLAWETDAVDPARRRKLEAWLREEGIRLHGVAPPRTTLEELFLDTLAKDEGGGAA